MPGTALASGGAAETKQPKPPDSFPAEDVGLRERGGARGRLSDLRDRVPAPAAPPDPKEAALGACTRAGDFPAPAAAPEGPAGTPSRAECPGHRGRAARFCPGEGRRARGRERRGARLQGAGRQQRPRLERRRTAKVTRGPRVTATERGRPARDPAAASNNPCPSRDPANRGSLRASVPVHVPLGPAPLTSRRAMPETGLAPPLRGLRAPRPATPAARELEGADGGGTPLRGGEDARTFVRTGTCVSIAANRPVKLGHESCPSNSPRA